MSRAGIADGVYNQSMMSRTGNGRNNSISSQNDKYRTQRSPLEQENQSSIDKIEGPKIDDNTDRDAYNSQDNYFGRDDQVLASGPSYMASKRAS